MPTTSDELSLINDTEFRDELEQSVRVNGNAADCADSPRGRRAAHTDELSGLESDLPIHADAPQFSEPMPEHAPMRHPYDVDETPIQPPPAQSGIPFIAAALVLIACLTAGAASAAVVFHDRLTEITARLASR